MPDPLILASGSDTRLRLLRNAGVPVEMRPARVDEAAMKDAMVAEGAPPRDVADKLAELKAQKIADRNPGRLVLGADQVLDFGGRILSKPETPQDAIRQLTEMRGTRHMLLSAAVIFDEGRPVWRHVGVARMAMRDLSDAYIADYTARNWPAISGSVGCYRLEEEGARLFSRVDGDYFTILGLPLLEILSYLTLRGYMIG